MVSFCSIIVFSAVEIFYSFFAVVGNISIIAEERLDLIGLDLF